MESKKSLSPLSIGVIALTAFIGGWLLLSMFGVFDNFLGWDARQAGPLVKVLSVAFLGAAAYLCYRLVTLKTETTIGSAIAVLVLIFLAVFSATGFNGTAGDIKQKVSYLDAQGRVADTDILFNCYEEFYHFKSNPELKEYVTTYGELPGRNRWNTYILSGELAPSKAPRANEDFKWHTGAYEMKIPKDCGK